MPKKSRYSSAKQAASRANGAKSRGPVSAEGKAVSALNNARHGLCSRNPIELLERDMVLRSENAPAIRASNQRLSACLSPVSELEARLAKNLCLSAVQLDRAWDVHTAALHLELRRHPHLEGVEATLKAFDGLLQPGQVFHIYRRYATTHERSFYRALRELRQFRSPDSFLPFEPENPATPEPPAACEEKSEPNN